ncbi:uncharacterized protein LTHEOB_4558 [Lasiodiplodia theobromae]|uniref:uncharacterized protein n=1 Tax=Lasiodiplodia theobromae TaxID=45133 RepID=UPI0015C370C1|nr:uncharacterized protein LTHEOB_4558 [Lasiodiplodia theobromae]KAF4545906.1 hypothetical protein LTHEOB_4558 [Lasiodiplodia theobromae]
MAAQHLPYDIIAVIVTHLKRILQSELEAKRQYPDVRLSPYATICKSWNAVVERETFRLLNLSNERMQYAEKVLQQNPARLSAVKRISFKSRCPKSGFRRRDLSKRQLMERDASFSSGLLRLFRFLQRMEKGHSGVERAGFGNLTLDLNVTSYLQDLEDEDVQVLKEADAALDDEESYRDILGGKPTSCLKYDSTLLRYVGEPLPTLHCVRIFIFPQNGETMVWSSTFTLMLSVMEGLEYCDIAFDDGQMLNPNTRIGYRKALGETLCKIPTTCEEFHATFEPDEYFIIVSPACDPPSLDILSIGIRNMSTQLVRLSLDSLAISPSLFWPDDNEDAVTPYWPRLKHFKVRYAPSLASGEWLVHLEKEDERCTLPPHLKKYMLDHTTYVDRLVLDCERANVLFAAVGRATRNMPALQEMQLEMSDELGSELHFTYKYEKERKAFVASWHSAPSVFEASPDVLEAFGILEGSFIERPSLSTSAEHRSPNVTTRGSIYQGLCSPALTQ